MKQLFLFQIGPVQAFIAQARRTQDLYVGSRMLSELARAGVQEAQTLPGFQSIFPYIDPASKHVPVGVPHRFAFVADSDPKATAAAIRQAIVRRWEEGFAVPVLNWLTQLVGSGDWQAVFEKQATDWLEFYWVAVDYDSNKHGEAYKKAGQAMAARRLSRQFHQVDEPGWKCTVSGSQSALNIDWGKLRAVLSSRYTDTVSLKENEELGTLALIKRFAGERFAKCLDVGGFPDMDTIAGNEGKTGKQQGKETTAYIAILHMDGDQMGARLSEFKRIEEHQQFSRELSRFAGSVSDIIHQHSDRAALVYAGGDDVLALAPIDQVLAIAQDLRIEFKRLTRCDASAGIAITPSHLPLDMGLEIARMCEEEAKEHYGRAAVAMQEAHGSGQTRLAGAKWDTRIVDLINQFSELVVARILSGKLAYDVQSLNHDLVPVGNTTPALAQALQAARAAELRRLAMRRVIEKPNVDKDKLDGLLDQMIQLAETIPGGWQDLANWLILGRFLAQGRQ